MNFTWEVKFCKAVFSSSADPTFAFVGGPCCPTLDFVIAFWTMVTFYTLLTLLFCISFLFAFFKEKEMQTNPFHRL
jgi:hypothetical protein